MKPTARRTRKSSGSGSSANSRLRRTGNVLGELGQTLGELIRRKRESRQLSQAELARRCGLSTVYMCNLEKDNNRPSLATLIKIAQTLECRLRVSLED